MDIIIKIKHSTELPDGQYTYQGEFTGKELDFLVEFAINSLLAQGAFPFVHAERFDESMSPYPTGEEMEQ